MDQLNVFNAMGHGAGRLVLELAKAKGIPVPDAATALMEGRFWEELPL